MITGEVRSKVDAYRVTLYTGGISNPISLFEKLTRPRFLGREFSTVRASGFGVDHAGPADLPVFEAEMPQ